MNEQSENSVSIFEYRCRRCHEVFTKTIEELFIDLVFKMHNLNKSEKEIEEDIIEFNKTKKDDEELFTEKSSLFEVHICEDGGRGLSDLIGCEPARDVTLLKNGGWRGKYRDLVKSNFTGRRKESPYDGV